FKTKKIFGKSFSRLWEEWKNEEKQKWEKERTRYPSNYSGTRLDKSDDIRLLGRPAWSEDGITLYASISDKNRGRIMEYSLDPQFNKNKKPKKITGPGPTDLSLLGHYLYYEKAKAITAYKTFNDLYAFDL